MISVLYVDDEPELLEIGKIFLEKRCAIRVDTALSPNDALKVLDRQHYDAIISDYQMPGMNGIEFLKKTRKKYGDIPFILFTGKGREEVVIEAINFGADFYIQKGGAPDSQFAELAHKVRQAVKRRRAESGLKDALLFNREVIEGAGEGFIVFDHNLRCIIWNRFMEQLTGIPADEIIGRYPLEELTIPDAELHESLIRHARDGETVQSEDSQFLTQDSGIRGWIKVLYSPHHDAQGRIIGVIAVVRDISERKRIEFDLLQKNEELSAAYEQIAATGEELLHNYEELEKSQILLTASEQKYRTLFEHTGTALVVIEEDTTISLSNVEFQRLSGYQAGEIDSKMSWTSLVHPDDLSRMLAQHSLRRKRHAAALTSYEFRLLARDGGIKDILLTIDTIPGTAKSVASLIDITPLKSLGRDLTRKNEELSAAYEQIAAAEDELRMNYNELAESQRQIEESYERYRTIFEHTGTAMLIIEDDTTISLSNTEFQRLSGYTRKEIDGMMHWDVFVHPDDLDPMLTRHRIRRDDRDKALRQYEFRFITRSGEVRDIFITIDTIPGTRKSVASMMDVTDRKAMERDLLRRNEELFAAFEQIAAQEEELRANYDELARGQRQLQESEERFHSLFNHMTEGHALYELVSDTAGTPYEYQVLDVNPAFETIIGLSRKEVIGKLSCDAFGTKKPPFISKYLPVALKGQTLNLETYVHSIKKYFLVSVYSPKKGQFATVFQDVTRLKELEKDITSRESLFRSLVDTLHDGVLILDPHGTVLFANIAAARMSEVPPEQVSSGINISTLLGKGAFGQALENLRRVTHGDITITNEYKFTTPHGIEKWVETSGVRIIYQDRPAVLVTLHEFTERKRSEEAMKQVNRQIHLLNSITRHDIVNKITVILGQLDIAKERWEDPALQAVFDKIYSATDTINAQIDFTRLYQDLGAHNSLWQDSDEILPRSQVPSQIMFQGSLRGIELYADPMLEMVFSNLLDNSIRHGGPVTRITVTCRETAEGLVISFADNGTGIPVEEKEAVFERGYGRNTGLGLFLVREILAITGIGIRETGTYGKGARFEIVVPPGSYRFKQEHG
jgi:PAS domain S-box-containing protein